MRDSVLEHLPDGKARRAVDDVAGFPNAAVDRIVPEQTSKRIDVLVEPFYGWVVDSSQLKGGRADVPGITYVDALGPFIERKLLTVDTGHSATAYLGYARGKKTIHESLEDARGDGAPARQGARLRPGRAPRLLAEGPRALREPPHHRLRHPRRAPPSASSAATSGSSRPRCACWIPGTDPRTSRRSSRRSYATTTAKTRRRGSCRRRSARRASVRRWPATPG